jgi:hypothetical protein
MSYGRQSEGSWNSDPAVNEDNLMSDVLFSQSKHYKMQLQDDGNLVVTDLVTNQPVWSWVTGIIVAPPAGAPGVQRACSYSRGPDIFVDAHVGVDTNAGDSWDTSLKTMAGAFKKLKRGGVIHLFGKVTEEGLVTPYGCTGVTIKGCLNRPSGRVSGEGPKAGGAWWARKDDNAGVPLLRVTQQGWRFENVNFIPNRNGGGLLFTRNQAAEDVTTPDAEAGDWADVVNCRFDGPAPFGICQEGGVVGVSIEGCFFHEFNKPDNWAVLGKAGAGIGFPLFWQVKNNRFVANSGDVKLGMHDSLVTGNAFQRGSILGSFLNKVCMDLTGGGNNVVANNWFSFPESAASAVLKSGVGYGADLWGPNYFSK